MKSLFSFLPYKIFVIFCSEEMSSFSEDPHCPSEMRGSGCFDKEESYLNAKAYLVTARNKKEAFTIREKFLAAEFDERIRRFCMIQKRKPGEILIDEMKRDIGWYENVNACKKLSLLIMKDKHKVLEVFQKQTEVTDFANVPDLFEKEIALFEKKRKMHTAIQNSFTKQANWKTILQRMKPNARNIRILQYQLK